MAKCHYCGEEAKYQLKNKKYSCFKNWQSCPVNRQKNSEMHKEKSSLQKRFKYKKCKYCNNIYNTMNLKQHERACYLNPINVRFCPICDRPIKNYKTSKTCGYSCSNKFTRRGVGLNPKVTSARTICFNNHIKKCVICKEFRIVSVHHYDKDKDNNNPENLIPLCPTHHQYMHSGYRSFIEKKVKKYIQDFISNCQRGIKCTTTASSRAQELSKQ